MPIDSATSSTKEETVTGSLPEMKIKHRLAFGLSILTLSIINYRASKSVVEKLPPWIQVQIGGDDRNNQFPEAVDQHRPTSGSCFRARNNTIHTRDRNLLGPYINVGMPKMGSTSLHNYFCCGNYTSSHWECGKGNGLCADCMKRAVRDGYPPLSSCGKFQSFMQMDSDSFFPQIELLEEIHLEQPNATFMLTFRDMNGWYRRGMSLAQRLTIANITGLPAGRGSNQTDMTHFFCNHVNTIRNFVATHPSHALIEIDIGDGSVGAQLERLLGVPDRCWRQTNINPALHEGKSVKVPSVCLH